MMNDNALLRPGANLKEWRLGVLSAHFQCEKDW